MVRADRPPYRALAYLSTAVHLMDDEELETLLQDSRTVNRAHGVSGVLLCCDQTFLQYIEGPPEGVDRVMQRILASRRHHSLLTLLDESVTERSFQDWDMGLARPTSSDMLRLSKANWQARLKSGHAGDDAGVSLLKNFWDQNLG
jgi:Sensors of blue-light using FAD